MPENTPGSQPRRSKVHVAGLVALLVGLLVSLLVSLLASLLVSTSAMAAEDPSGPQPVTDAVLRWGVSNEANNSAFAPGTYNFFSAGKVPDPGKGGTTLARADWRQKTDNLAIEKWNGTAWRPATWAGLSTTADGTSLGNPTSGRFSNHQMVFSAGIGTIDVTTGSARIAWAGDVTVLLYSGMSFFYISDPVLDVSGGKGQLTGTLSGFASSQDDTTVWEPVDPQQVTLADLPAVTLTGSGFSAQPAYAGVRVAGVPQSTTGASTGAFPQSWVDFMGQLGTAGYWYSSGGSTDPYKAALPVTIGIGDTPVTGPVPAPQPTAPEVDNTAPPPPQVSSPSTASGGSTGISSNGTAPPASLPAPPAAAPPAPPSTRSAAETPDGIAAGGAAYTLTAFDTRPDDPSGRWWQVGTVLLGLALILFAAPRVVARWRRGAPSTTPRPIGAE